MKTLYLLFFFSLSLFSSAQTFTVDDAFSSEIKQAKIKTYALNVAAFELEVVEDFKKELLGWDDKIAEVIFNPTDSKLYISHTNLFNETEFIDLLSKYKMSKKIIIGYY